MKLTLDTQLAEELASAADRLGLTHHEFVYEAIREKARPHPTPAEIVEFTQLVVDLARARAVGTEFRVKDLARLEPWWIAMNPRGHNPIGSRFRREATTAGIVRFIEKNGANAARYVRI